MDFYGTSHATGSIGVQIKSIVLRRRVEGFLYNEDKKIEKDEKI